MYIVACDGGNVLTVWHELIQTPARNAPGRALITLTVMDPRTPVDVPAIPGKIFDPNMAVFLIGFFGYSIPRIFAT